MQCSGTESLSAGYGHLVATDHDIIYHKGIIFIFKLTLLSLNTLISYSAKGIIETRVIFTTSVGVMLSFSELGQYLAHFFCEINI